VSLDDLVGLVSRPGAAPVADVESTARLAHVLRTPTPTFRPELAAPVATGSRSAPAAQPHGGRALHALVLIIVILAIVGVAARLTGYSRDRLRELTAAPTTSTTPPPPLDGPTIDAPSGQVRIALLCTTSGAGWEAHLHWPTTAEPAHVPVAYEVMSATEGVTIDPKLWLNEDSVPGPLTGLSPGVTLTIAAQGILADGTRLAPSLSSRTIDDRPC
jgi:hypothetical protein